MALKISPTCAAVAVLIPFTLAACDAPLATGNRTAEAAAASAPPAAAPTPAPAPAPAAATLGLDDAARPAPAAAASPAEGARRCGWLVNPTPGNWWLYDRDGEWILATQGSEPVPGMDDMPDMSTSGWIETNGHYGYGCACVTLAQDPDSRRVTKVADFQPKPLKLCRADKRLPRP